MPLSLNPYRLAQLLILAFTYFAWQLNGFDHESTMLYVNISLYSNLFIVGLRSGIVSTKFILSFIIFSVALVHGLAWYLIGFKLYSYVNFDHQLNDQVTIYVLWLYYIASNIYTYVILEKDAKPPMNLVPLKRVTRLPFYFLCALILAFTFLMEGGGTIISTDYKDIYESRPTSTTIANVIFTALWVDAYALARNYTIQKRKTRVWIFWGITAFVALWLLLHARRTEAIGFLCIILLHIKFITGKTQLKYLFLTAFSLFLLYLIGYLRQNAILDSNVAEVIIDSLKPTFEGGSNRTEFANMPSGLGNIAASMQTSVYHFYYMGHDFLNGETILTYPYKLMPSGLVVAMDLIDTSTIFYNDIVLEKYFYNGGTYLFAPAYGNFGAVGLAVGAFITGLVINWTQKAFYSNDFIKVVIAATIIFTGIKVVWYNVLPLVKTIMYNLILLSYIALIFKPKNRTAGESINPIPSLST